MTFRIPTQPKPAFICIGDGHHIGPHNGGRWTRDGDPDVLHVNALFAVRVHGEHLIGALYAVRIPATVAVACVLRDLEGVVPIAVAPVPRRCRPMTPCSLTQRGVQKRVQNRDARGDDERRAFDAGPDH